MKPRALIAGLALLTSGAVIGTATQQFAAADVDSGDRPILVPIEPCRLVDTRDNGQGGPRTAPLGNGEIATFDVAGVGTDCEGRIPADATGVSTNMTALNATAVTFLSVWPGGPQPTVSSLNPRPGAAPTPNAVTTEITPAGTFQVYNDAGNVGLFIDVNGYYVNHTHADQHPTIAAFDDAVEKSKYITINVFEDSDTNITSTKHDDLNDMGVQSQSVDYQFMLPPDYTAGTDLSLRVIAYALPDNAPCSAQLNTNWTNGFRPGSTNFRPGFADTGVPGNPRITKALGPNRVAEEFEFTILGANLQPRDAIGFGLFWLNCPAVIAGIEVLYE